MSTQKHLPFPLGSAALLTTLALTSGPTFADVEAAKCAEPSCAQEEMELIKIHGVRNSIYKVDHSGDIRRQAELFDIPQTITVLTKDQIDESGRTDLKEIMASQAGVTLGTGENGNAFGDRYIIRGHEARSDVFVDGLRDPGMSTRESFSAEQIEITKGPSSTFAGRGSSGGAVNSITKKASTAYNFGRVDASLGTDEYHRIVLDYNKPLTENFAARVNLLSAEEQAPGRDGIERSRDGLLLSGLYDNTSDLRIFSDFYYLDSEDTPDLGSYIDSASRKPVKDIPVYAQDEDFLDSQIMAFTVRTEYDISDTFTFYNATRYGETENGYISTGARGNVRAEEDVLAPNVPSIGLSTHQGWQEIEYFATQFNFLWDLTTGEIEHALVFGLEFTDEQVINGTYDLTYNNAPNCSTSGRGGVRPGYCLLDENTNIYANPSQIIGRTFEQGSSDSLFAATTVSAYLMDTAKINDEWQIFFGLRVDSIDYSNDLVSRGTALDYAYQDEFYNGHLGLVYQIAEHGNIYATYATATNINGGESDVGASCGYGGLCGDPEQASVADPELVENIELGTKWEFFEEKLFLAATWFQMTKSDVMESVGDAYSTLGTLNTGKNRVDGFEFALNGNLTETISLQISAASMQSEVLDSITETNIGRALSNFAEDSFYLQLRYQPTEKFAFGGDFTYKSEMFGGQPDSAAGFNSELNAYSIVVPSYTVLNLFANYNATENITLRLNVGNIADKEYWTAAYRSGAFMYLGDGRTVRATLTYEF